MRKAEAMEQHEHELEPEEGAGGGAMSNRISVSSITK